MQLRLQHFNLSAPPEATQTYSIAQQHPAQVWYQQWPVSHQWGAQHQQQQQQQPQPQSQDQQRYHLQNHVPPQPHQLLQQVNLQHQQQLQQKQQQLQQQLDLNQQQYSQLEQRLQAQCFSQAQQGGATAHQAGLQQLHPHANRSNLPKDHAITGVVAETLLQTATRFSGFPTFNSANAAKFGLRAGAFYAWVERFHDSDHQGTEGSLWSV